MLVAQQNFDSVLSHLLEQEELGLDTETTGLRMFHGDRLFSIIIASHLETYYFNFIPYDGVEQDLVLTRTHLEKMKPLWAKTPLVWYIQNAANFDLPILAQDGIILAGEIHCTKAIGRVLYNDYHGNSDQQYSLEKQLERIGMAKDDKVKEYIEKHKLWTDVIVEGKAEPYRIKHFDRVPFNIIVPYGEMDAHGTLVLGLHQTVGIKKLDHEATVAGRKLYGEDFTPSRTVWNVVENERRLQKTLFRMKMEGVLADIPYCKRAAAYETDRMQKAVEGFKRETGRDFSASAPLFEEVFASEKHKWGYTEKGNPSFESDNLKKLDNPAAALILQYRDAKARSDFYNGFLFFSDSKGNVHPNYKPEGTVHGRFSSSEPNFQNLTSEDDEESLEQEFVVRRALIPPPGYIFIMPDWKQMEYKFLLELACRLLGYETPMMKLVKGGADFHDSTIAMAAQAGAQIVRKEAKTGNFLTVYGGGAGALADTLKIPLSHAHRIRHAIFSGMPEMKTFIDACSKTAEERGYVMNWMGRRSYFPNKRFSYKACNYVVSGGCADITKLAMNRIDEAMLEMKSKLVMTIHDELPCKVHESEISTAPKIINDIMETAYQGKYLQLTCDMEWSAKSLADKIKGFPV